VTDVTDENAKPEGEALDAPFQRGSLQAAAADGAAAAAADAAAAAAVGNKDDSRRSSGGGGLDEIGEPWLWESGWDSVVRGVGLLGVVREWGVDADTRQGARATGPEEGRDEKRRGERERRRRGTWGRKRRPVSV